MLVEYRFFFAMASLQEQMNALQAQMAALQARLIEEEAAKAVRDKVATIEERVKEGQVAAVGVAAVGVAAGGVAAAGDGARNLVSVRSQGKGEVVGPRAAAKEAKAVVKEATGGGRWRRSGGSDSGSESSSSMSSSMSSAPSIVRPIVRPGHRPQAPTLPKEVLRPYVDQCIEAAKFVLFAEADALVEQSELGDEMVDALTDLPDFSSESDDGQSSTIGSSVAAGSGATKEELAAVKKAAKKALQKEKKAVAKASAKAKRLEERFAELNIDDGKPKPKRLAHDAPDWKQVACKDCGEKKHWRYMPATWTLEHKQRFKNEEEDRWSVFHRCVPCEAKATGKTEDEVTEATLAKPMARKKYRADSYKQALAEKREEFEMQGADITNTQLKKITRVNMTILIDPFVKYLTRKADVLNRICKDVERHRELTAELRRCRTLEDELRIMAEMSKLEIDDGYLAFESKGPEQQHRWIQAASFSDSWTMIYNSSGKLTGAMCSYYLCFGMTRWNGYQGPFACCRVVPSKEWDRLHADPTQAGQRYYCKCGTKHNAGYGQLVEIKLTDASGNLVIYYMRAPVPDWDIEDVRAMYIEDTIAEGCNTPQALYNKIQTIRPSPSSLVVEDPTLANMQMLVSKQAFDSLPEFSWWELFTFAGVTPPKGAKKPAGR